jgi:transcriptional regulator with XRE-family HTH domain
MTVTVQKEENEPRRSRPDPVDIHVGARLRLRRNLIGMSQEQLGKATDLTFQQIQKYERGMNRMGASRLYQLARILGVDVSYFFDEMAVPVPRAGFSDARQSPSGDVLSAPRADDEILKRRETLEFIRAYYRILDPKKRRKVYELIKTMADGDK